MMLCEQMESDVDMPILTQWYMRLRRMTMPLIIIRSVMYRRVEYTLNPLVYYNPYC